MERILEAAIAESSRPEIDLTQPGAIETFEAQRREDAIAMRVDPQLAAASVAVERVMLETIVQATPEIQAEIDAIEAQWKADRVEAFGPEDSSVSELEADTGDSGLEEEPEHLVALRATISRLRNAAS
jgi:hypothetical protein